MSRNRRHLSAAAALIGLILLASAATAGPGSKGLEEAASHVPDSVELPAPEGAPTEGAPETEGQGEDTHGACVSTVAQSDERDGLEEGWRGGLLVSLVAQDESMVGEDCDFSSHLDQATNAEPRSGGEAEGAGDESSEAGDETSDEARQGGRDFGESKKNEHEPGS